MKIRIRKANPGDVPRLFEVWESAVAATHDFVTSHDKAAIAKLVRDDYLPNADLDLAVDENDVALAFMGRSGDEIDSLFVHADARGNGVGRMLCELAFTRGGVIRTEVNEQNTQGVGFWQRMGFRIVERLPLDRQGRAYPILIMERDND